jgi:hypothetical protein
MKPNRPDKETANILGSVFDNLDRQPPVVAQIDEAMLRYAGDQPVLDRQEPDDIIRCWFWKSDGPQLCSVAQYLKRKKTEEARGSGHSLEFVMKRTGPDEAYFTFFWRHLGKNPLLDITGFGILVRKEGEWVRDPKQFFPTLWSF